MNRILYALFVWPLSLLPLWITFRIADLFYLLLISVFPYRRKVIDQNLTNSFPDLSQREIVKLRRKFYKNFAEMMVEGIKNLSISENELKRRFHITNPELMKELYAEEKSVLLVSAHYMNWEWMITGQPLFFPHQAVGIGMPLSNGFWDKKITQLRSRFGMEVIHAKNVKEKFETYSKHGIPTATLVLSDQSPADTNKSYWMPFLNQDTAVLFGAEQLANQYNQAVVYYLPKRIARGKYEITLELLTKEPHNLNWGELTEAHTKRLEKRILEEPDPWLWSHKRWKRDKPENIEGLKTIQREKFNSYFRNTTR